MIGIQTSLYLVAAALCAFCTGFTSGSRRRPVSFFTAFLVIQSGTFLCELLMAHPATPLKALWLALLMGGSLLLAPCLWLAIQQAVGDERPGLRDLPRMHLWVIVAGFICTLPLMLSAHLGTTYANPADPIGWPHARFIHTTMLICVAIFVVQVPWYLVRCRRIVLTRLAGTGGHWAELPLAIVLTTWVLAIVRTLDCAFIKWPPMFSLVVAVVSVGITMAALFFLLRKVAAEQAPAAATEPGPSYAKSPLGDAQRERIRNKLESCLVRGSLYKKSDLNLGALSAAVKESPHYVSQVISQDLNTTFYELVNGRRIDEAKRLLRDRPGETVLAIAMDVGFNSKSAFHAAFRRVTGTTPSEYRGSASLEGS